jgi:hypothetical protein
MEENHDKQTENISQKIKIVAWKGFWQTRRKT